MITSDELLAATRALAQVHVAPPLRNYIVASSTRPAPPRARARSQPARRARAPTRGPGVGRRRGPRLRPARRRQATRRARARPPPGADRRRRAPGRRRRRPRRRAARLAPGPRGDGLAVGWGRSRPRSLAGAGRCSARRSGSSSPAASSAPPSSPRWLGACGAHRRRRALDPKSPRRLGCTAPFGPRRSTSAARPGSTWSSTPAARRPRPRVTDVFDDGRRAARFLTPALDTGQRGRAAYRIPTDRRGRFRSDPRSSASRSVRPVPPLVRDRDRPKSHRAAARARPPRRRRARRDRRQTRLHHRSALPVPSPAHDEFLALRDYEVGDDLRRVHWRSSARTGELLVREDESAWQPHATVVLDNRARLLPPARATSTRSRRLRPSRSACAGRVKRAISSPWPDGRSAASAPHDRIACSTSWRCSSRIRTTRRPLVVCGPRDRRGSDHRRLGIAGSSDGRRVRGPGLHRRHGRVRREPTRCRRAPRARIVDGHPAALGGVVERGDVPASRHPTTGSLRVSRRIGVGHPVIRSAALALVSVATAFAFGRVFADGRFVPVLLGAAVIPHAIGAVARARGWPPGRTTVAGCRSRPARSWSGSSPDRPPRTASPPRRPRVGSAISSTAAGRCSATASPPFAPTAGVVLLCAVAVGAAALIADAIGRRPDVTLGALAPTLVLFVLAGTLGTEHLRYPTTVTYIAAALAALTIANAARVEARRTWFTGRRLASDAAIVRSAATVGGAALLVALVLTPLIPGVGSPALLRYRNSNRRPRPGLRRLHQREPARRPPGPPPRASEQRALPGPVTAAAARGGWSPSTEFDGTTWSLASEALDAADAFPSNPDEPVVRQQFRISSLSRSLDSRGLHAGAHQPRRTPGRSPNRHARSRRTRSPGWTTRSGRASRLPPTPAEIAATDPARPPLAPTRHSRSPTRFPDRHGRPIEQIIAGAATPWTGARALRAVLHRRIVHLRPRAQARRRGRRHRSVPPDHAAGSANSSPRPSPRSAAPPGLPTRVVVGFTPGNYDEANDEYIVRGRDAHAWVEVWFAGLGWRTFEPTPAGLATRPGRRVVGTERVGRAIRVRRRPRPRHPPPRPTPAHPPGRRRRHRSPTRSSPPTRTLRRRGRGTRTADARGPPRCTRRPGGGVRRRSDDRAIAHPVPAAPGGGPGGTHRGSVARHTRRVRDPGLRVSDSFTPTEQVRSLDRLGVARDALGPLRDLADLHGEQRVLRRTPPIPTLRCAPGSQPTRSGSRSMRMRRRRFGRAGSFGHPWVARGTSEQSTEVSARRAGTAPATTATSSRTGRRPSPRGTRWSGSPSRPCPSLRALRSITSRHTSITRNPTKPSTSTWVNVASKQHQPGDEPDDRPLDGSRRMPVQGGLGDLLHQTGVGRGEVGLDLREDPQLFFGKRHRPIFAHPERVAQRGGADRLRTVPPAAADRYAASTTSWAASAASDRRVPHGRRAPARRPHRGTPCRVGVLGHGLGEDLRRREPVDPGRRVRGDRLLVRPRSRTWIGPR